MRLEGKGAVITGAARGNGLAFARAFAAEGAAVVLVDSDDIGLKVACEELVALGSPRVESFRADVRNRDQVNELMTVAHDHLGGLDIVVNNAGVLSRHPVLELEEEEWDRVLDINLKGTFLCAQAAARIMVGADRGGSIINICSVNAFSGGALTAHYCASKGGVLSLTKSLAVAFAESGIRVNALAPGPVDTELSGSRSDDPERLAATVARIPMGRIAQPEDLVGAALFLASDDSAYVTGSVVCVDGGWLAK